MRDKYQDHDLEALVEVADGSQWTVTARNMRDLVWEAQNIIGRDLRDSKFYVRYVNVDGEFSPDALNELLADIGGK